MRRWAIVLPIVLAAAGACADDSPRKEPPPTEETGEFCQSTDEAFAARAILAVVGRRPWGASEVKAVAETHRALREALGSEEAARAALVGVLARDPDFSTRWVDFFMDVLRVPRFTTVRTSSYGEEIAVSCYGEPLARAGGSELAEFVRDAGPAETNTPTPRFKLAQLLTSSIALDDLSPILRAHLFHLLLFPLPGANVAPDDLELARRADIGARFEEVFLGRNPQCLACHNSEFSVTASADPATNRAWPLPGLFEKALYGNSTATLHDPDAYHAMFRIDGVVGEGRVPWGWDPLSCGRFQPPPTADDLAPPAHFGSIRATSDNDLGARMASVWSLEASLRRGVVALRDGLQVGPGGEVDPDEALAYLVGANTAEQVWREVIGTPLTIANYFPRTEVQRDTLQRLTDAFVTDHFSLRRALSETVSHEAFNLAHPTDACWGDGFTMPRLFDAFTDAEQDETRRLNGPGDRIAHAGPRALVRRVHVGLEWAPAASFPKAKERDFQIAIGMFHSEAEPGYRGFDLRARLAWEERFGRCESPDGGSDYISRLVERAVASGATVEDAIKALRDRLLTDASLDDEERGALEALTGTSLLSSAASVPIEEVLRRVCGAYVTTPEYLLDGVAPILAEEDLVLEDPAHSHEAECGRLAEALRAENLDPGLACASLRIE